MAGVENARRPQPRYSSTWKVGTVTAFIDGQGDNKDLSLKSLTLEMAMLLALTRPSRSTDLQSLDIQCFKRLPEEMEFLPSKLPKQTKAGKTVSSLLWSVISSYTSISIEIPIIFLPHFKFQVE